MLIYVPDIDELFASGVRAWKTRSLPNKDRLKELVDQADKGKLRVAPSKADAIDDA